MTMTFPLLRQNQHQLREHTKRQPRPQREESRGVWRSRSDGGGSHPDLDSAPLRIRHKGIGLIRQNGIDSLQAHKESHATKAEGTQHNTLQNLLSRGTSLQYYKCVLHSFIHTNRKISSVIFTGCIIQQCSGNYQASDNIIKSDFSNTSTSQIPVKFCFTIKNKSLQKQLK